MKQFQKTLVFDILSGNMPTTSIKFYIDSHIQEPQYHQRSHKQLDPKSLLLDKNSHMKDNFLIPLVFQKSSNGLSHLTRQKFTYFQDFVEPFESGSRIIPSLHDLLPSSQEMKPLSSGTHNIKNLSMFSRNSSPILPYFIQSITQLTGQLYFQLIHAPSLLASYSHNMMKKDENDLHDTDPFQ